ncbi:MAG: transcriptional repressor [Clostridiales bacterium]|nr:transcriptional repressor [Clostridiales bacterium]
MDNRHARRNTHQRNSVLEAAKGLNHPTAREIYLHIAKASPISLGTVYRNLQVLIEEGALAPVIGDPSALRYDHRTLPHHHLYCRGCAQVYDLPLPYDARLNEAAAAQSGLQIESHAITFQGLCPACGQPRRPAPRTDER